MCGMPPLSTALHIIHQTHPQLIFTVTGHLKHVELHVSLQLPFTPVHNVCVIPRPRLLPWHERAVLSYGRSVGPGQAGVLTEDHTRTQPVRV